MTDKNATYVNTLDGLETICNERAAILGFYDALKPKLKYAPCNVLYLKNGVDKDRKGFVGIAGDPLVSIYNRRYVSNYF